MERVTTSGIDNKFPHSEAMRRAWAKYRESAAREAAWFAHPTCLCGCGRPLARNNNIRKQHFFLQGHAANLKALLERILGGNASSDEIPDDTRNLRSCIRFLKRMPELRKGFECGETSGS